MRLPSVLLRLVDGAAGAPRPRQSPRSWPSPRRRSGFHEGTAANQNCLARYSFTVASRPPPSVTPARTAFAGIFVVTGLGLLAVGATLPVLPRYVDGPLGGSDFDVGMVTRRVRDHRPRLPAARRPARRPARPQAGRDRRRDLDRDRRAALFRPRRDRRPDRRPALPRRRRGRRLHRRLGLDRRHDPARAARADHRALRAGDLGRAGARAADRRADPAGDQLRDGLGVRGRGAARRRGAGRCGSPRASPRARARRRTAG